MRGRSRREGRPSPPPPAILHAPGETLAGAGILDELREPLGTVLWQTLQDVLLWASAPPPERAGLFADGAGKRRLTAIWTVDEHPGLQRPLMKLGRLLEDPASVRPHEVAEACRRIVEEGRRRGAAGTALAFAQAAALADPADATAALETGTLAAQRGEEARAESWLRRAVVLARRRGNGAAYARACLELGHLYARREAPSAALRAYLRALRHARRKGVHRARKAALDALFDLAPQLRAPDDADALSRAALGAGGTAHPRAPELLRGWVRRRLARGPEARLPEVADLLLAVRGPAAARAHLLAILAREAAFAGAREAFERAWNEAGEILEQPGTAETIRGTQALMELTHAAMEAQVWPRAEYAGQRALESALRREDAEALAEVEALLTSLWRRTGRMGMIGTPDWPRRGG